MSKVKQEFRDPCEYNPSEKRAAYDNEIHASAEMIVGANGKWRVCASCASLPEFKRFRVRRPIVPAQKGKAEVRDVSELNEQDETHENEQQNEDEYRLPTF